MKLIDKIKEFLNAKGITKIGLLLGAISAGILGKEMIASFLTGGFIFINFDAVVALLKSIFIKPDTE